MADLDEALVLVATHFRGVRDKSGAPYVLHCLRVMMGVDTIEEKMVAVMHDLVEDTDVTIEQLRAAGFSESVLAGVDLVTHKETDSYADYVGRIKNNPLARSVKLADLKDNLSPDRVLFRADRTDRDIARIQKYLLTHQFLNDEIAEDDYRDRMSPLEAMQ